MTPVKICEFINNKNYFFSINDKGQPLLQHTGSGQKYVYLNYNALINDFQIRFNDNPNQTLMYFSLWLKIQIPFKLLKGFILRNDINNFEIKL